MWTDTSKPAWMAAMEAAEGLPKPPGPDFSGTMNTLTYAPTAYRPDRIPAQLPSSERSWLKKMGRIRLPWGNTQELAPAKFFYQDTPADLRFGEEVRREDAKNNGKIRAPLGNSAELATAQFIYQDTPGDLRIGEEVRREDAQKKANGPYKARITETEDLHYIHGHQRHRFGQLSGGGRFWTSLY